MSKGAGVVILTLNRSRGYNQLRHNIRRPTPGSCAIQQRGGEIVMVNRDVPAQAVEAAFK